MPLLLVVMPLFLVAMPYVTNYMSDGQNWLWSCRSGFGECIIVFHIRHILAFGECVIVGQNKHAFSMKTH